MSLASIKKIDDLIPLENADSLCRANIEGWSIVVKKGEFMIGDLCVYIEIDSILPDKPEFSFLKERGFRVKTIRLRGCLSQGIAFPMTILPKGDYTLDQDVTELLGVQKFSRELQTSLTGLAKGNFPNFMMKTDEPLMQGTSKSGYKEFFGLPYYISTKIDGTSSTFFFNTNGTFGACSRNFEVSDGNNIYWDIVKKYDIEKKLIDVWTQTGRYLGIQGEIAGPKIQGNKLKLTEHQLFIFDIYDIVTKQYLPLKSMLALCAILELPTVPIEETGDQFTYTMSELLERAKGNYASGRLKEGIVVRPINAVTSKRHGNRLSFKVMNNDFLEKDK